MPYLRREQLAGMGIHYMYHSLDYFLECQEELGFKTIEMCAEGRIFSLMMLGMRILVS